MTKNKGFIFPKCTNLKEMEKIKDRLFVVDISIGNESLPPNFKVIKASSTQTEKIIEFKYKNNLTSISSGELSALYFAIQKNYTMVVKDKVTERVCKTFNVETISPEELKRESLGLFADL